MQSRRRGKFPFLNNFIQLYELLPLNDGEDKREKKAVNERGKKLSMPRETFNETMKNLF